MNHLKIYEQFNLDIDPYGEEDWTEGEYKIVKAYMRDSESLMFQGGVRFYLTVDNFVVSDFETLKVHNERWNGLSSLNYEDIEKLESGKYLITNGYATGSILFQKISLKNLRKIISIHI